MPRNHSAIKAGRWRKGLFRSFQARLAVAFSLIFAFTLIVIELVDFFGIPFTPYAGRFGQARLEARRSLELIADLHEERLRQWMKERHDDGHAMSTNRIVTRKAEALCRSFEDLSAEGLRGNALWSQLRAERSYADLLDYLSAAKTAYGVYEEILFADAVDGTVLISTNSEHEGAPVPGKDSFRGALESGSGDYVGRVQVPAEGHGPVFHLSHVVYTEQGKPLAVLMMQISMEDMVKPLLHTGEGLGARGEVLLVNREHKILTSLKHTLPGRSRPKPLQYRVTAEPAVRAAGGGRGVIESEDYGGRPVLAAYRYIDITPQLGWGMVVKRDREEMLAPLRADVLDSALVGLIGVVAVVGLTIAAARTVTRPVRTLSNTAGEVAEGNLAARAPVTTSDEVGALATTFNTMVDRVENWQKDLEAEVHTRTAELRRVNEELIREARHRKKAEGALRASEARYRGVYDTAPLAFVIWDRQRRITGWNHYAEELFGWSREEILGKDFVDALVPETARPRVEQVVESLRRGQVERDVVNENLTKSGMIILCQWNNAILRDDAGEMAGAISLALDITERVRAEKELAEHRDRLEELVQERTRELREAHEALVRQERLAALGRLTATVSHELRNPLGTIRASLFTIARRLRGKQLGVETALNRVERNIDRCDAIVTELLEYGRIKQLQRDATNVDDWLDVLLSDYKIPHGIELKRELAAGVTLLLDVQRFRCCMVNLISNACQAMQSDGGRLVVSSRVEDHTVRICVRDTGCGIPPDEVDKVFEPLFSTKNFGVGLGLAIVQQVVQQHQGRVEIDSAPGRGTAVTLHIPIYPNDGAAT